jgi:hypothetical protein
MANKDLINAVKAKNDEFYTQISDIEKECSNYMEHFRGKTIFCNCDDPYESNFFKYFALNFSFLGIKKLIATCYAGSSIANKELSLFDDENAENKTTRMPHKIEIYEIPDINQDGAIDLTDVKLLLSSDKNHLTRLKGNGDFRSQECIEILKEADVVVTNPPFSLFREYITQLVEYKKSFLIIGNTNALTYKDVFKLIKENKLSTGITNFNVGMYFIVPDTWKKFHKIENGKKLVRNSNSCWFTNLDHKKRHEKLILYKNYTATEYPKYDNYDAIEVSAYKDIPKDYDGLMGVPITFVDKYNPDQFEIIGLLADKREKSEALIQGIPTYLDEQHKKYVGAILNGKATYARIVIKRKK